VADFVQFQHNYFGGKSWHGTSHYEFDGTATLSVQFGEQVYGCLIQPEQMQAVHAAVTVLESKIKQLEAELADARKGNVTVRYEGIPAITSEQVDQILKAIKETHRG
jgi:hypothetical protein